MRKRASVVRPLVGIGVFLAVLVAGLFVAFSVWFGSYIQSEGFRAMVADKTGKLFDASAGFSPLRWTGASAYAESATLEGSAASALKSLSARELRAEMNWRAAFSGSWRVEEITITRLDGEWRAPDRGAPASAISPDQAAAPSGFLALLPKKFELGLLSIGNASLRFRGAEIAGTSLTVKPDGMGWIFEGKGGGLTSPWAPGLDITDFRVRQQGKEFFLTRGNLRLGANGKILLSGESASGGRLEISWDGIASSDVFKGEWHRRLEGVLSGTATLAAPDTFRGSVVLRDGRLENLPMLATIAEFTQNPAFRRMPLQEVRGDFIRENNRWHVSNFSAESKGLLKIEGTAVIGHGGALEGNFQIGVTPHTLQWLPGSRERVFTKARDGYLWTDLKVGGTIEKPTENLSARMASAMGEEIIGTGANLIEKAPGTAVEGVKGVLDILRPLVR